MLRSTIKPVRKLYGSHLPLSTRWNQHSLTKEPVKQFHNCLSTNQEKKYRLTHKFEPPFRWIPVQEEIINTPRKKRFWHKHPYVFYGFGATIIVCSIAAYTVISSLDSNIYDLLPASVQSVLRVVYSVVTFVIVLCDYKYSLWMYSDDSVESQESMKNTNRRVAKYILNLCLSNGGIYIKAGQHIASLNQLLPAEITTGMEPCQDRAPTRPWAEIEAMFIEETGHPVDYFFEEIDKEPIAAASLAQVYRGKLRDGREVALKVQYPRLRETAFSDVRTFDFLISIAEFFFPEIKLKWLVKEFEDNLPKELDFMLEGMNNEKLMAHLKNKFTNVRTPKVIWELTTPRIIALEFIDHAVKVSDRKGLAVMDISPTTVSTLLAKVFSQQIFLDGFVHCDPHPGNILVRRDPNSWNNKLEIIILDHGLYQQLDDSFRVDYALLWKSIVERDEQAVKSVATRLGVDNFELFASMLTSRSWGEESAGIRVDVTEKDQERLMKLGQENFGQITRILSTVNKKILLLFKCNELLRSVQQSLGVPVNYFVVFAKYAMTGINRDRIEKNNSLWTHIKCWKDYVMVCVRLQFYVVLLNLFSYMNRFRLIFKKARRTQRRGSRSMVKYV
ncbi:aarF domain-containing protein kinase [Acrasis kona]|uniref:AarF domain-containing protein kinase n=1 Tax=Acrasis kona TaxID=1008807 RepID=A0AAW2ZA38_9EUKA